MFREMIRKDKQLPTEVCRQLLIEEKRGILSVIGEDGYPYGTPMNHWYDEECGKIYFHCGRIGHRLDALERCDKASFCVVDKGEPSDKPWALTVKSVIVFGRVEIIDDAALMADVATKLSYKFTQDDEYIRGEIEQSGPATLLLCLTPEHICGKQVVEA
ncbi:MAG: pyridoxamine 5'-phosphate oxidase family protein [Clostridia bacterium]|nr:pyridoxamine 5'-phosphate oxidase family protein [Clostridia bacterium]